MTNPDDGLYRVEGPRFVAGLTVRTDTNGRQWVSESAPILRHWRGRRLGEVQARCAREGWSLERVDA